MLFADLTGQEWAFVIGAIFVGIMQVVNAVLQFLSGRAQTATVAKLDKAAVKQDAAALKQDVAAVKIDVASAVAARKAEEVKTALQLKAEEIKQDVAQQAKEVKNDVALAVTVQEQKLDVQDQKLSVIHNLVNSSHGDTLRMNAAVSRRLANITKDSEDIAAAELAERLYQEHMAKQASADKAQEKQE